jgi:hypothetical protein
MKSKFVADGYRRFLRGKKAVTSESIEAKYAVELAKAGSAEKILICERMVGEYSRRITTENHKPSPGTLW